MKKLLQNIVLMVLIAIFLVAAYQLYQYLSDRNTSTSEFNYLRNKMAQVEESPDASEDNIDPRLVALRAIYEENPDFIGWLTIEDTVIDYPVMQTKNDPEYYLLRTFNGISNNHGTLFASADCDVTDPTGNTIIYGHHMKDGTMFAALVKYESVNFYMEHSQIQFDTLEETGTYEIVAVFKSMVYTGSASEFEYYSYVAFDNKIKFDEFFQKIEELSLYQTNTTASYGDKLITLSTCEFTQVNGRMVIVAKKV